MKTRIATWLAAGVLFLSVEALAAPPPASAFAALPEMSMVRLSPNGQRVAWANDPGGSPLVVVFDLATGKDLKRLRPANSRVRDLDWADDRMLIISVSRSLTADATTVAEQRYEFERYLALDVEDPKAAVKSLLMEHPDRELVSGASLERLHPEKPGTVIMSTYNFSGTAYREEIGSRISGGRKDSGWELALFEVDIKSGKGRIDRVRFALYRRVDPRRRGPSGRALGVEPGIAPLHDPREAGRKLAVDLHGRDRLRVPPGRAFRGRRVAARAQSARFGPVQGLDDTADWRRTQPALRAPALRRALRAVRPLLGRTDRLLGRRPEHDDGLDRPEVRIDPEGHLQGLRGKDHLSS